jgi:error-prone DNA polymerase
VNASGWDHTLEEKPGKYFALRLGFRIIKGIRQEEIAKLLSARVRPFATLDDVRNTGIGNATLEKLADADCFRSLKYDRRAALWEVSTKDKPEALFAGQLAPDAIGEHVSLTVMQESEHVVQDYATTSLSLRRHPVSFVRDKLAQFDIIPAADLANLPDGSYIKVAGLVLVRQRPGTAGGVLFMTIEDETGVANLVIFETLFEQYRKAILQSRLIMVQGKLQKQGDVIHVIVMACYDYSKLLRKLLPGSQTSAEQSSSMQLCLPLGKNKPSQVRQRGDEISFPGARDFR